MNEAFNATDVRKEWGKFIDSVVHEKPGVVKRNRDFFLSLSINHALALLADKRFKAIFINEDDGSVTATLDGFDLAVNEKDVASAKKALAGELVEYATEYFSDFKLYYNSLNRQSHFPYVLKVLIQKDTDRVLDLIDA